jgi:DNA gyrase subunit A
MQIQQIRNELKEKKEKAKEIEGILASKKKLWGVIKGEMETLIEKFPERRKTRMASDEDVLEFDEEAYIARENTNVVLTRNGYIKRVGRLASVETTRVQEGDEVVAVVPGSTLDHVVFFSDDGVAYTMRINEVPATTGYGDPITKFFKLGDGVKVVAAVTTDPRFTLADQPTKRDVPGGPYVIVGTRNGFVLRTPLASFRTESTKNGRRYAKLEEGDKVVMVRLVGDEEGVMLATAGGYVTHFPLDQVTILAGVGKGVFGIKLDPGDVCVGGVLVGGRFDKLVLETESGGTRDFGPGAVKSRARGGKGEKPFQRTKFTRVVPPPIELTDWEAVEGKKPKDGE